MQFSLRLKFVLAVLLCLAIVMAIGMSRLSQLRTATFEKEVHNRTTLVSEFGRATQAYVAEQLKPATQEKTDELVLEAMSSFYAKRKVFEEFNQALPDYIYREPTLNPLNPLDRADDFETKVIRRFQLDQNLPELTGYRQRGGEGEKFYVAKPTTVRASCLACHGKPEDAPPEIVKNYGRENGYHWKIGEVVSASMIYVPTNDLRASQAALQRTILITFLALALALAGALLGLFEGLINRRIVALGRALQQRTLSPNSSARLTDTVNDEVGVLARQFNQMADALDVAYQDLEDKVADRTRELTGTLESLKSAQARLVQAEKMSSLGQMVGGIAHEINNPANFIYGNLQHTREYVQSLIELVSRLRGEIPPEGLSEALQQDIEEMDLPFIEDDFKKLNRSMQIGAERIRDIVTSLRNFARLDETSFKKVDIHEGIESALLTLYNRLEATPERSKIEIVKDYSQLPLIQCFPAQINQVIFHLLNNAIDALDDHSATGYLSKTDYLATVGHNEISDQGAGVAVDGGSWVPTIQIKTDRIETGFRISIVDNGGGIEDSIRQSIFDPFFTTKPVGKGTGLGLAISHQIMVETHGGELICESTPGQGTMMMMILPFTATSTYS
ncbi:MAG: DUF3365 domain-containing protein [Cyanobacteria bacterium P01_F01_bin.53]